jgi:glutaminyl-tRNA synthetase
VWIEREDFEEVPPKGYKRLFPGNKVRLKGGYVIECTGCIKDAQRHHHRSARHRVPRHQERHARQHAASR